MSQFSVFIVLSYFIVLIIGAPIKYGEDVGLIHAVGKFKIAIGQKQYPFMVNIKIVEKKVSKNEISICGGVIIGKKAVLTAAHCVVNRKGATIHVHAGIVDRQLEANEGQKVKVSNILIHKNYRDDCIRNSEKCCLGQNDVAILWLEKQFEFGPTVEKANLIANPEIPLHKEGWILGWGLNSFGKLPTMLQKGHVKVISIKECKELNPIFKISENTICVIGVNGMTVARPGDSGGPLVINNMVYGLSSKTVYKKTCSNEAVDLYTFIPAYYKWIEKSLRKGPRKESPCIIC